jgi:ubiquinone/menaquinone biosynthesis C-methylase UbiE
MDATKLGFPAGTFDVVSLLEVLEHIPAVPKALAEAVRVARRFVVLSVPSKPDDNPDHIHLLSEKTLRRLFSDVGITRVTFDYVPGHVIAVANVQG